MATAVKRDVVEAFRSIGVDDERAWKAAEALSGTDERLTQMETRLGERIAQVEQRIAQIETRLIERIAKLEARFDKLTWMTGTMIAFNAGVLIKLLVS